MGEQDKDNNDIEFNKIPEKSFDKPADSNEIEMKEAAIKKLEKAQMDAKVKAEAGILQVPRESDQIPKELPKYLFKIGSKSLSCPKFNIDDDEAKLLAKHLSILIGSVNSKLFSFIIIIIVVLSKLSECMDAVKAFFGKRKKPEPQPEKTQNVFDETKNSQVSG